MYSLREKLLIALFVALAVASMCVEFRQWQECKASGGAFVRGAVWYECVQAAR